MARTPHKMSSEKDLYKILGVSKTATQKDIKNAYRSKSRAHHPDKHGAGATEKMQQINHAHEILSDPKSRKKYDQPGVHPSIRQPRTQQPFGSGSDSGPGYCASCNTDPCACFIFKPAGSSGPSDSHSPTTCWDCHQDIAGKKHIKLSCGCCTWCSKCADRAFSSCPDQTQKTLHRELRVTFEEAQDILSRDVWHACNVARRPVCHWCKTVSADFVVGLCKNHLWCRKCFISIYTVATKDPRCCHAMVSNKTLREHLPEPVAALYRMKLDCRFRVWQEKERFESLMEAVKVWQGQNRDLVYGPAACEALGQKDAIIKDLETKLRACREAQPQQEGKNEGLAQEALQQKETIIKDLEDKLRVCEEAHRQQEKENQHIDPEALEQKNATIKDLEAKLKLVEAKLKVRGALQSQQAGKGGPESSDSKLADELVRKNMKIKALENSNKLLKEANVKSIAQFSEAGKARKIATDSEATVRKENAVLAGQLAAVRSQLAQQTQNAPTARKGSRANDQDELVAAQEAHKTASNSNAAAQKRLKDLEAENCTLRQDLETQKQDLTKTNKKLQDELAKAQAAQQTSIDIDAAAEKQMKELTTQTANLQQELENQKRALADEHSNTTAAQSAEKAATDQSNAAQQQIETLKTQLNDTATRVISAETALEPLRNRVLFLEGQIEIPREQRGCPECGNRPSRTAKSAGSTSSQAQSSQNKTAGLNLDPSPLASDVQTENPCTEGTANTVKPNNIGRSTGSIAEKTNNSSTTAFTTDNQQPPAASVEDKDVETPISLLKGQLHYANARVVAAQDMTLIAVERTLDLNEKIRRYKKFEKEVHKELARANKMYTSLDRAYDWAMTQLRQHEVEGGAATKVTADGFVNGIDNTSKSTRELLATLYQQFTPVRTKMKKSDVTSRAKSNMLQEPPLKIAARRNRKLRETIRQKEQEIANVRIHYGQKWSKVLDSVAERDTEIRWLKRRLHIRESRTNSDASIGAGEVTPLSEKDEQIKSLKARAGVLRGENTGKEQKIEALSTEAKDLKQLKIRNAKLRFDLEEVLRKKKNIVEDVKRRTST